MIFIFLSFRDEIYVSDFSFHFIFFLLVYQTYIEIYISSSTIDF